MNFIAGVTSEVYLMASPKVIIIFTDYVILLFYDHEHMSSLVPHKGII